MFNRKAISKLKAIFIIDLIIVAAAAGSYLYLTSQGMITSGPGPAEFTLTNFSIEPPEAEAGEPVIFSFNLTNVGETEGNYTAILLINNSTKDNLNITLAPLESILVTNFTDIETVEGNYTVQIGDLTGSFHVKPAPPTTSSITLSTPLAPTQFVTPYEGWPGEPIIITVVAKNPSSAADILGVKLTITQKDSQTTYTETKRVELEAGQTIPVGFTYNATSEGIYSVKVGPLTSGFVIVPTGMHSLLVVSAPKQGLDVKIDGKDYKTPHTELLTVGVPHTVAFPAADPTGKFGFLQWEPSNPVLPDDGSKNPSRQISITGRTTVKGSFSGGSSCPSLYVWNGNEYVYVQEVSNHGWLGYTRYVNDDGSLEYWRNNPWDYIPLDKNDLQLVDGNYLINLTQRWNEIFFLDATHMVVIDHPSDMNVYSTMVEQYIDPDYMGQIYTVSKNPSKPVSAINELVAVYNGTVVNSYNKVNVLPAVSSSDEVFTTGFNGKYSQDWNNQTWNRLTLDLGNLAGKKQIKLIVKAMVDWGPAESYMLWMNKFYSSQVPYHTEPTPPPFMEVKDANGNWIRVPENRQFPLPPDLPPIGSPARTFVVDLTGLFPTNDYSLRINNFWNVTFDFIGIDTSTQEETVIQKLDPTAFLRQEFYSPSASSGSFTKYGDVTSLLLAEDDEFVIGRQGDSVSLMFPVSSLAPLSPGMERDYFFFAACWFKVEYANYGFGPGHDGFTVEPLPFRNMSGFPYPFETEGYPFEAHSKYHQDYNTRVISPQSQTQENSFAILIPVAAIIAIVAIDLGILVRYRKRNKVAPP